MPLFIFWRLFSWQRITVASLLVLALFITPILVFGQEEQEESVPSGSGVEVSAEVASEAEAQLTVSAEAAKESTVDLKAELGLSDFDPVVPNNFINSVGYGLKSFGRDVQETLYDGLASDKRHAQLLKEHSDKELVEAIKLHSIDPGNDRVVGILEEYKTDLTEVRDNIEKVKEEDEGFAKELSAEVAQDNLFMAPKILNTLQESLLVNQPQTVPEMIKLQEEVLTAASQTVVSASSNETEMAETLKIIAEKNFKTPFSGIATADVLLQAKEHLNLSEGYHHVFDDVIEASLDNVEGNLKTLEISDELKAESFKKYVEQLPGQSISRMKVIEQFRSRADLSPVMMEKMTEVKARLAENISRRIDAVVEEEVRKAMTKALFEFKDPGIEEIRLMDEVKDLVPSTEIRNHMKQKHEEGVARFINKFGDDANARQVTEEFQALTRRVDSGEVVPNGNFFKTLETLRARLKPEQQRYIEEMEETGKQEMASRMKTDENFAHRFSSFNPADVKYFEEFKGEFKAQIPNFEAKFAQIERQQAENFQRLLDVQNDPGQVRELEQHFKQEIPPDIKEKFERNYQVNFEDQFHASEEKAREKEEFFRKKAEETQKEYQEKFGNEFPGQGSVHFPNQPGFGFPGRGPGQFGRPQLIGPPTEVCSEGKLKTDFGCEVRFEKPQIDPSQICNAKGGKWMGSFCQFEGPLPDGGLIDRPQEYPSPEKHCAEKGGTWFGTYCKLPGSPTIQPFDPSKACAEKSGTWRDNYCKFGDEPFLIEPTPVPPPSFTPPPSFQPPPTSTTQQVKGASTEYQFDILDALFSLLGLR